MNKKSMMSGVLFPVVRDLSLLFAFVGVLLSLASVEYLSPFILVQYLSTQDNKVYQYLRINWDSKLSILGIRN